MKKRSKKYLLSDIFPKYSFEDLTWGQENFKMEKNLEIIDEKLLDLEEFLDKKLTPYEESRILEIVDEHTPKDKDGNYFVGLLPFEYAWEIFEEEKKIGWERFRDNWRKITKK